MLKTVHYEQSQVLGLKVPLSIWTPDAAERVEIKEAPYGMQQGGWSSEGGLADMWSFERQTWHRSGANVGQGRDGPGIRQQT